MKAPHMAGRRKQKISSGEIAIVITAGVLVLIMVTGNLRLILEKLYSPYAALIAVIVLVEYVLLRGADRSTLYRRELEAARAKRREDLLAMRQMENQMNEMKQRLAEVEKNGGSSPDAAKTREELESLLEQLRSRI